MISEPIRFRRFGLRRRSWRWLSGGAVSTCVLLLSVTGAIRAVSFLLHRPAVANDVSDGQPPRVTVESGELEGRLEDGLQFFKGIPFAAPPVGELRWRAPQPPQKRTGIHQAYAYGNDAPQKTPWAANQDEDCLYLNVWAPADAPSKPYPVMAWIHNGGFINGSGRINGEPFAKQGVVFVSFNYRLGRLGFFAHPALDQQRPPHEPPANFWLQDLRRAIAQSGIGGFGPYRRWRETHAGREPLTKIGERFAAAQGLEAASAKNYLLRAQDVTAVLDQLAKWNGEAGHELAGRLDARTVGMSGHSFGGHTTQVVAGQKFPLGGQTLADARVKAAIVMSPSAPERGDINAAFGSVKIPWLLMTGTHDAAAIGSQTPESRRRVFPALAPGDKFELVLDMAEHSAFTKRPLPGEREQRNPNHHRAILALSTAFWDAYLRHDAAAKSWLTGDGPRRILEPADVWQKK